MRYSLQSIAAAVLLSGCASLPQGADPVSLRQQVTDAERAFARTMANRDHAAFASHLAAEAIFFSGETPVRLGAVARCVRQGESRLPSAVRKLATRAVAVTPLAKDIRPHFHSSGGSAWPANDA